MILLKDVATKKFHILRRRGREHGNNHTIGDARRVNDSFYSLERQRLLMARGRVVSKISPNSSEILDILDVPVPSAPDASTASAADAILGRLLANLEPRRFLDVGASSPHLVLGSTAPTRVAVSTRFDFDPRTYAASGIDFYELRLSQYAYLFHEGRPVRRHPITGAEFEKSWRRFASASALPTRAPPGSSVTGSRRGSLGDPDDAPRLHRQASVRAANDRVRRAPGARRTVNEAAVGTLSWRR